MNNDVWDRKVQEQNEDLKTLGDKGINVRMTDKEFNRMTLLALKVGLKDATILLESFIGDLTGCHSNGSDECDIADKWYDRTFGICEETHSYFRYYLFNYYIDAEELIDEDYFEEIYNEYLEDEDSKKHDSKEECMTVIKELIELELK